MTSEDTVEDPLMSVQFHIKSKSFSFRVRVRLLFSLLLQKTLKFVFLSRYKSLKLNHDRNYLMISEDTVEDPLMSVHFYIRSKSFFFSCYSPSTFFRFYRKRRLNLYFYHPMNLSKLKNYKKYLMTSENIVEDPLMSNQFYIKSKSFFHFLLSPSTVFILLQKTLESVFLPGYEPLKLNHDTNYLMTPEDTAEDPLMSVQFCIKSKSFSFRVTVHLLFSFLLKKTLKSVLLPPDESLKQNHDTNYSMTSDDTVEDPLMSNQFCIKSESFFISC